MWPLKWTEIDSIQDYNILRLSPNYTTVSTVHSHRRWLKLGKRVNVEFSTISKLANEKGISKRLQEMLMDFASFMLSNLPRSSKTRQMQASRSPILYDHCFSCVVFCFWTPRYTLRSPYWLTENSNSLSNCFKNSIVQYTCSIGSTLNVDLTVSCIDWLIDTITIFLLYCTVYLFYWIHSNVDNS